MSARRNVCNVTHCDDWTVLLLFMLCEGERKWDIQQQNHLSRQGYLSVQYRWWPAGMMRHSRWSKTTAGHTHVHRHIQRHILTQFHKPTSYEHPVSEMQHAHSHKIILKPIHARIHMFVCIWLVLICTHLNLSTRTLQSCLCSLTPSLLWHPVWENKPRIKPLAKRHIIGLNPLS